MSSKSQIAKMIENARLEMIAQAKKVSDETLKNLQMLKNERGRLIEQKAVKALERAGFVVTRRDRSSNPLVSFRLRRDISNPSSSWEPRIFYAIEKDRTMMRLHEKDVARAKAYENTVAHTNDMSADLRRRVMLSEGKLGSQLLDEINKFCKAGGC